MIKNFKGIEPIIHKESVVLESADIIGEVLIEKDASIWYGSVLRGDLSKIRVGERSNVQDLCVIHTEKEYPVSIGNDVTVGHNAILHGCTIKNNVLIGMGSIVMDGSIIEENCIIGAGTLIPVGKRIPAGHMAFGSPVKIVRELTTEEIEKIQQSAINYVNKSKEHSAGRK